MKKILLTVLSLIAINNSSASLPVNITNIINQARYAHSVWALYVKNLASQQDKLTLNENLLIRPASGSKLFSVAALLDAYGFNARFNTPVYALGSIDSQGVLHGNLILVGQGDFVFGGRGAVNGNTIAYTAIDHVDANAVPGASLTPEDPLAGIQSLAKQIKQTGINTIDGDVLIDTRLFDNAVHRESVLSPIVINENLIDISISARAMGQAAEINWRPQIKTMKVINHVVTGSKTAISIHADSSGMQIEVKGSVAANAQSILRTYPIKDPSAFVRTALIEALTQQGVVMHLQAAQLPQPRHYQQLNPIAHLLSPPMIEYAKLILKVSQNFGANMIPVLLASHHGKKTYDDGMHDLSQFFVNKVHIPANQISFGDAAGGNGNYVTPMACMQLLTYFYQLPAEDFAKIIYALPILGVDGSLASVAQNTAAKGKVFAKTGTNAEMNALTEGIFLDAKSLTGYYKNKEGQGVRAI